VIYTKVSRFFLSGSCEIDISPAVDKYHTQFNNIMCLLGKYSNELAAVHVTNNYALVVFFTVWLWNVAEKQPCSFC